LRHVEPIQCVLGGDGETVKVGHGLSFRDGLMVKRK
jgi:hypothetical protein